MFKGLSCWTLIALMKIYQLLGGKKTPLAESWPLCLKKSTCTVYFPGSVITEPCGHPLVLWLIWFCWWYCLCVQISLSMLKTFCFLHDAKKNNVKQRWYGCDDEGSKKNKKRFQKERRAATWWWCSCGACRMTWTTMYFPWAVSVCWLSCLRTNMVNNF